MMLTLPGHARVMRPLREDQERIKIWGSCSKQHSPVLRASHQTDCGLSAPRMNGDHTPAATHPSFHPHPDGAPAIETD